MWHWLPRRYLRFLNSNLHKHYTTTPTNQLTQPEVTMITIHTIMAFKRCSLKPPPLRTWATLWHYASNSHYLDITHGIHAQNGEVTRYVCKEALQLCLLYSRVVVHIYLSIHVCCYQYKKTHQELLSVISKPSLSKGTTKQLPGKPKLWATFMLLMAVALFYKPKPLWNLKKTLT